MGHHRVYLLKDIHEPILKCSFIRFFLCFCFFLIKYVSINSGSAISIGSKGIGSLPTSLFDKFFLLFIEIFSGLKFYLEFQGKIFARLNSISGCTSLSANHCAAPQFLHLICLTIIPIFIKRQSPSPIKSKATESPSGKNSSPTLALDQKLSKNYTIENSYAPDKKKTTTPYNHQFSLQNC